MVGATAVGKTSFAINVAQYFNTKIISCDSRQCYKELNIGVAKPSFEELKAVEHYFISSHSIHQNVNVGVFEQYSLQIVNEIFVANDIVVMVGGTGLYANAFCNGIDEMPNIDIAIRANIIKQYETNGLEWLQQQIAVKDPIFWQQAEQQNPQRLMRALEIVEATGNSITHYKKSNKVERNFNIIKIGLELPRQELIERIDRRVDMMLSEGLVEEVKGLINYKHLNALQTVGYSELFDCFENKYTFNQAIEKIKIHTRQYAKRQMTWFKKDLLIQWINPLDEFDFKTLH
ncbi:MAG: tRNA (adenosine(37)-N6)-dimethylallyltransferase MiaA [Bacteroidetes bacterium]|nr:tRNA (adenosine(37)-N6)-dimethylallyltransferase MiaA [Bacteroidota bacterium]